MKKGVFIFVVSICFVAMLKADESSQYRYEVMPTLAKQISKADVTLNDSKIFYGIRALVRASDMIALQVGYERSDNVKMGDGGKSDVVRGVTNLLLDFPTKSKFTPYLLGGLGYERLFRSYAGTNSQVFLNGGAGVKYSLSDRVDLVTEGRIVQKIEDKDTDAILTAGLSFKYGSKVGFLKQSSLFDSENIDEQSGVIHVKDLAKLTPAQPVEKVESKEPKIVVEEVEVVDSIKGGEVLEEVVVESIEGVDNSAEMAEGASAEIIHEEIVVQEESVPVSITTEEDIDVASLEPVEFVGEPVYEDINTNEIIEEDFSADGYYVQMEAVYNEPTTSLLDKLDARGYSYILQPSVRKGRDVTLVLVGPYATKAEAKRALKRLKRIKKDAFIYKLK